MRLTAEVIEDHLAYLPAVYVTLRARAAYRDAEIAAGATAIRQGVPSCVACAVWAALAVHLGVWGCVSRSVGRCGEM